MDFLAIWQQPCCFSPSPGQLCSGWCSNEVVILGCWALPYLFRWQFSFCSSTWTSRYQRLIQVVEAGSFSPLSLSTVFLRGSVFIHFRLSATLLMSGMARFLLIEGLSSFQPLRRFFLSSSQGPYFAFTNCVTNLSIFRKLEKSILIFAAESNIYPSV